MGYPITEQELKHDAATQEELKLASEIQAFIQERTGAEATIESIVDDFTAYEDGIESDDYGSITTSWIESSKFTGIDYDSEYDIETVYQAGKEIAKLKVYFSNHMQIRFGDDTNCLDMDSDLFILVANRIKEFNDQTAIEQIGIFGKDWSAEAQKLVDSIKIAA